MTRGSLISKMSHALRSASGREKSYIYGKHALEEALRNAPRVVKKVFFAPEMDYIDNEFKLVVIKKLMSLADVVTIATSPFFIEQNLAINWLKRIM